MMQMHHFTKFVRGVNYSAQIVRLEVALVLMA